VFAQSNYQPAIIINNEGDSLSGKVDYRNWKKNPQAITFLNARNEMQVFDVYAIKGFYILAENETYTSYTVDVDMHAGDGDVAMRRPLIDSPVIRKRVFLLQLVADASLRLYQYTDKNKEHFYYRKAGQEPVELIHNFIYNESGKQVNESLRYREQLSALFADCQTMNGALNTIKFGRKNIQDIFLKYLQCKDTTRSVIVHKVKDGASIKFGIVGGLMSTTFRFEGTNDDLTDDNYRSSVSPVLGVLLDIGLPRGRNKWHIVNELTYKSYQTGTSFTRPYNNSYTRTSDVEVSFAYVQINSICRYIFPTNTTLKPYINLGMGNAFIVAENKNALHMTYSWDDEENSKAFDGPNKYEFSLIGGLGLMLRNVGMELRYAGSKKGFSPYQSLDVNPRSFQFLLHYQF
jgi:hypothetical protein